MGEYTCRCIYIYIPTERMHIRALVSGSIIVAEHTCLPGDTSTCHLSNVTQQRREQLTDATHTHTHSNLHTHTSAQGKNPGINSRSNGEILKQKNNRVRRPILQLCFLYTLQLEPKFLKAYNIFSFGHFPFFKFCRKYFLWSRAILFFNL